MAVQEKQESKVNEGFNTPGPKQGEQPPAHAVFEGFTTPGPHPEQQAAPEAWNTEAFIQSLIDEGFSQSADEAFRFHVYRFGGGVAGLSAKKEALRHEAPRHKEEPNRKGH